MHRQTLPSSWIDHSEQYWTEKTEKECDRQASRWLATQWQMPSDCSGHRAAKGERKRRKNPKCEVKFAANKRNAFQLETIVLRKERASKTVSFAQNRELQSLCVLGESVLRQASSIFCKSKSNWLTESKPLFSNFLQGDNRLNYPPLCRHPLSAFRAVIQSEKRHDQTRAENPYDSKSENSNNGISEHCLISHFEYSTLLQVLSALLHTVTCSVVISTTSSFALTVSFVTLHLENEPILFLHFEELSQNRHYIKLIKDRYKH